MKKLLFPFLAVCLLLPSAAFAEKFTATGKVTAVTVYANRAAVTRTATVKIPKGAHEVVFENLPTQIAGDSLRVEGSAVADVKLGALAHKQVVTQGLSSAKEQELTEKLQKLRDMIVLEQSKISALDQKRKLLQKIGGAATAQTNEEFKKLEFQPKQWLEAATAVQGGIADVLKSQHQHKINIRNFNEAAQKLETELNQQRTGARSSYQVRVPLESSAGTELTLALTYQVGNASWRPIYDARLDTETGELALVQYGAVRQLSGESWDGVTLTLSTAQPHRGASPPSFNPLWINKYSNRMNVAGHLVSTRASTADMAYELEEQAYSAPMPMKQAKAERRKAQFVAAQIDTGGFVAEYRVAGPATILSDNNETKLMVGSFDVESTLEIHIQPQHTTEAFLVARGKLNGEATVLPGQVSLFRDGAYIGKARFPLLRPSEEHNLFFGVDDQISVTRNTLKDERKEGGMIIKDSILERHYVTEVQNLRKTLVDIRVRETIPVSKDEDIKVEILRDKTTQGYKTDIDKIVGLTEWSFTLAPEEQKDVRLGWKVTWPSGDNIQGLP